MIGSIVKVIIDRPMGSRHPDYPDMIYPINYGYVKGIIAPDGEEQDAYVLGVDEPISNFCGRVVAIIQRLDDVENKLVVAPNGIKFTENDIKVKTHFQEKYFKIKIIM